MESWANRETGHRRPWRYLPELLRNLERVSGEEPCDVCGGETDALQGLRARLTWCPECLLLSVHDGSRERAPALLGPMGRPRAAASPPGLGPTSGLR